MGLPTIKLAPDNLNFWRDKLVKNNIEISFVESETTQSKKVEVFLLTRGQDSLKLLFCQNLEIEEHLLVLLTYEKGASAKLINDVMTILKFDNAN